MQFLHKLPPPLGNSNARAASRGWILEKRQILRHDSVPPSLLKTPRDSSCDRCVERLDPSRINETNYEKILRLLCAERSMNEEVLALPSMIMIMRFNPSLRIYKSIIHGYADNGKFEEAMLYLNQMKENCVLPETETYDGLIEGYGKWQLYDEIVLCVKRMEAEGCARDHVTYNLLVCEFARGGLLKRLERMYQSLMSRKMTLEPVTLVSML
ncbi:hypothetical protein Rs2_40651 [Raphanus sativus]|nr:hypothetical protein Rs2_40651 [Raphanus sativus]